MINELNEVVVEGLEHPDYLGNLAETYKRLVQELEFRGFTREEAIKIAIKEKGE